MGVYNWAWPQFSPRTDASTQNAPITQFAQQHLPLPRTPWQVFTNGLGCTLLQHPTSPALIISPTPAQREFACGACIGTALVGVSLVAPLKFIFKQPSLCYAQNMIIIPCHIYLYCLYSANYSRANTHGTPPYPSCLLLCIVEVYAYSDLCETLKKER